MLFIKAIDINEELLWTDLINQSQTASFFQTPEWLRLWLKHFDGKAKINGIYDGGDLIGMAPFYDDKQRVGFLGLSPVLGNELVTDFGDIIVAVGREKEVWEAIIKNNPINKKKSKWELNFVREDSPSFSILQQLGGKVEEVDVSPYIDLPKNWEEYLASLERKDRHELKRKMRRLEGEGAVKVCYDGDPDQVEEFFRLMALSDEQKRNFLSPQMKDFFRDIIQTFWSQKKLWLCFLKLEDKNIAVALLFEFKNEMLLYNSGFDPAFFHLSAGLLVKALMIKQAIEEEKKRFDFLRGGERYKYDLGAKERKLYNISL